MSSGTGSRIRRPSEPEIQERAEIRDGEDSGDESKRGRHRPRLCRPPRQESRRRWRDLTRSVLKTSAGKDSVGVGKAHTMTKHMRNHASARRGGKCPRPNWPAIADRTVAAVPTESERKSTQATTTATKTTKRFAHMMPPIHRPLRTGSGQIARMMWLITRYAPWSAPHATKVQPAPCQSPPSTMVVMRLA